MVEAVSLCGIGKERVVRGEGPSLEYERPKGAREWLHRG